MITINSGSVGNNTSGDCGIQFRDNDLDSKGYIQTNNDSTKILIKPP